MSITSHPNVPPMKDTRIPTARERARLFSATGMIVAELRLLANAIARSDEWGVQETAYQVSWTPSTTRRACREGGSRCGRQPVRSPGGVTSCSVLPPSYRAISELRDIRQLGHPGCKLAIQGKG
jgi:hypothetical protein